MLEKKRKWWKKFKKKGWHKQVKPIIGKKIHPWCCSTVVILWC